MNAPLAGLRVLEMARVPTGPWIRQTLADLGGTSSESSPPKPTTPAVSHSSGQTWIRSGSMSNRQI